MTIKDINSIYAEYVNAWRMLSHQWQETVTIWRDPVSHRFDNEFWQPLEIEVESMRRELERLIETVKIVSREK